MGTFQVELKKVVDDSYEIEVGYGLGSKLVADIDKKMKKAAAELNFEAAAELRDRMIELKKQLHEM